MPLQAAGNPPGRRHKHAQSQKPTAPRPAFVTADPTRSQSFHSQKSMKENAFKKLLIAGDIEAASKMLQEDPILRASDLTAKIHRGNSYLHASIVKVKRNAEEFVDLIIAHRWKLGVGLDERNADGQSALHLAIKNNKTSIAEKLILGGAYLNLQDRKGNTPLHVAIDQGSEESVRLLLKYGAIITIKNRDGLGAQAYARNRASILGGNGPIPCGSKKSARLNAEQAEAASPAEPEEVWESSVPEEQTTPRYGNWGTTDVDCWGPAVAEDWGASNSGEPVMTEDSEAVEEPSMDMDIFGHPLDPSAARPAPRAAAKRQSEEPGPSTVDDWTEAPQPADPSESQIAIVDREDEAKEEQIPSLFGDEDEPSSSGPHDHVDSPQPTLVHVDGFDPFGSSSNHDIFPLEEPPQDQDQELTSFSNSFDDTAAHTSAAEEPHEGSDDSFDLFNLFGSDSDQETTPRKSETPEGHDTSSPPTVVDDNARDSHGYLQASVGLTDSSATHSTWTPAESTASLNASVEFESGIPTTHEEHVELSRPVDPVFEAAQAIVTLLQNHVRETGPTQRLLLQKVADSASLEYVADEIPNLPEIINSVLPPNSSPLLHSINSGVDPAAIDFIIYELGANPKIQNVKNTTPLHAAVQQNNAAIVSSLLVSGANAFARDQSGSLPIDLALSSMTTNWEIITALLENMLERTHDAIPGIVVNQVRLTLSWVLRQAVKRGKVELIKFIVTSGVIDPTEASTANGWTPLHVAIRNGDLDAAQCLLSGKSSASILDAQTNDGFSALHIALERECDSEADFFAPIQFLLRHGADPNLKTKNGISPLHMICKKGQTSTAKMLLEEARHPVDMNPWHDRLCTPLWLAFKDSHSELCELLVLNGATTLSDRVTYFDNVPLVFETLRRADNALARAMLVEKKWSFDPLWKHPKSGIRLYNLAVLKETDNDVASVILSRYFDIISAEKKKADTAATAGSSDFSHFVRIESEPSDDEKPDAPTSEPVAEAEQSETHRGPLHTAVLLNSNRMIELLCSIGFDPNEEDSRGVSPISLALLRGQLSLVRTMATLGGAMRLDAVARIRRKHPVRILIELGFAENELLEKYLADNSAHVPAALWFAIALGFTEAASWLLFERFADPNTAFGKKQRTILHHVVQKGDLASVKMLLAARERTNGSVVTNVNVQDASKWSPLHIAIQRKNVEICLALLDDLDCNPSLEDDRLMTPLHLSLAVPDMTAVAEKILESSHRDLQLDCTNAWGLSPLDYAARKRQWAIAGKIMSRGRATARKPKLENSNWTTLHLAAANGFVDIVHAMCRDGDLRTINAQEQHGWTPLHLAVNNLQVDCVETLLRYGASVEVPTHTKWNPLHTIAKKFDLAQMRLKSPQAAEAVEKVVHMLLRSHSGIVAAAQQHSKKFFPFEIALVNGNVGIAEIFMEYGVVYSRALDLTNFTGNPVHAILANRNLGSLRIVLKRIDQCAPDRKAKIINAPRGRSSWSALHVACTIYNLGAELAEELMKHGADPFVKDSNGQNVLFVASQFSHNEIIRVVKKNLTEKRARKLVRAQADSGYAALDVAPSRCTRRLLRNGFEHQYRQSAEDKYKDKKDKKQKRREKASKKAVFAAMCRKHRK